MPISMLWKTKNLNYPKPGKEGGGCMKWWLICRWSIMYKNKQEKVIGRKQSIQEQRLRQANNNIGILINAITLRYPSSVRWNLWKLQGRRQRKWKNKHLKRLKENDNLVCKKDDRWLSTDIKIIAPDRATKGLYGGTHSDANGLSQRSRVNRRGPPAL